MSPKSVSANLIEHRIHTGNLNVVYPSVFGLKNEAVQLEINQLIQVLVNGMMAEQGGNNPNLQEMTGTYKVGVNENSLLSLRFENVAIMKSAANGTTMLEAMTVNLETGEVYSLNDLFLKNRPYRIKLNRMIEAQIKQRQIPLTEPFPGVTDAQDFYLTPFALVVFFQENVFTPHYVGPPEFTIPYSQLTGLINPGGPIGRLI